MMEDQLLGYLIGNGLIIDRKMKPDMLPTIDLQRNKHKMFHLFHYIVGDLCKFFVA
uniref:Uncharacterized protein n=1 Tax=Rhizophora mucronata TaxID=61149 RepID=A0A2P2MNG3_RHIMU